MDVAKVVAYLTKKENRGTKLDDIYGVGVAPGGRIPLVQVPTTAGTGSEVTQIAVIKRSETVKAGIVSPTLLPDWAILDGALTTSVPKNVTIHSGIDAMVHAIEAYTSLYQKNSLSDTLAREAVSLLTKNIYEATFNPTNEVARGDMLLGSLYAGMAFANSPCGAVHGLAYPIAAHFHVSHGHSNTMMLPAVLKYTAVEAYDMYAELAPCMFPQINSGTNQEKTARWIESIEGMC